MYYSNKERLLKRLFKDTSPPGAIEFIDFNLKDFSKIEEAIKNSDIVINLIGILFENRKQKFTNIILIYQV